MMSMFIIIIIRIILFDAHSPINLILKSMQRIKPPYSHTRAASDSSSYFSAWDCPEPSLISLKFLEDNLCSLQRQYQANCKSNQSKQPSSHFKPYVQSSLTQPFSSSQINKTDHFSSSPSILNHQLPVNQNRNKLPQISMPTKWHWSKPKQIQLLSVMPTKVENKGPAAINAVLEQAKYRKRSGSEFSQMKNYFPAQVSEADIFIQKDRMINISKVLNLKRKRGRTSTKLSCYNLEEKENTFNLIGKSTNER